MPIKHTIEEMKQIAMERGGECLSSEYKNIHVNLRWKCKEGHEWETSPSHIIRNSWCRICGRKKITFQDAKDLFEERGYVLLETKYTSCNTKMRYRCPKHSSKELSITMSDFKSGKGCPYCAGNVKPSFEIVKTTFEERGYELLESTYINSKTKMRYICPKHPNKENSIAYNNLKSGYGCPYCAGLAKLTLEDVQQEFEKRGYVLVEKDYINTSTKMRYHCPKHPDKDLSIAVRDLKSGRGCAYCAEEKRFGEGNHSWKGGISDMTSCLRGYIDHWKKEATRKFGNKCYVTGCNGEMEIHHTKPFYVLRDEVFTELKLPMYKTIGEYSQEEKEKIKLKLKEKHNDFVGIPLIKEIHDLFHKIYGRKNTTMEDLEEFKERYLSGEFNKLSSII